MTIATLPRKQPQTWDAAVGQNVKRLLAERGKQTELATALHLGQPEISKRINGKTRWQGRELFVTATVLGVTMDELCDVTPPEGVPLESFVRPPGLGPGTRWIWVGDNNVTSIRPRNRSGARGPRSRAA
jgi:hypothetical protein